MSLDGSMNLQQFPEDIDKLTQNYPAWEMVITTTTEGLKTLEIRSAKKVFDELKALVEAPSREKAALFVVKLYELNKGKAHFQVKEITLAINEAYPAANLPVSTNRKRP